MALVVLRVLGDGTCEIMVLGDGTCVWSVPGDGTVCVLH